MTLLIQIPQARAVNEGPGDMGVAGPLSKGGVLAGKTRALGTAYYLGSPARGSAGSRAQLGL